jgi:CBS domain-containing protein
VSVPVTVVPVGTTRGRALAVMREHGLRHLPLVAHRAGGEVVCVGLLVDRDLALAGPGDRSDEAPVDGLARTEVPRVVPGDPPRETARAVLRGGCDAALVVERGSLVGIVTATDVLRALSGIDGSDGGARP